MNKTQSEPTDIFLWANNNDGVKNELDIELFLFSKNYVPYSVTVSSELDAQIRPLFLYDVIGQVVLGAGTGMAVKDYELSEGEENTVLYTDVEKVTNAQALINLIEHQRHEVVIFAEEEHEMKRMKGVIARFTHKDKPGEAFYIAKQVMTSQL